MKIHEVMRPGAFTIQETDSLGSAQRAMTRAHIRHLPVMCEDRIVGMLSERDVLAARAHTSGDDEWWTIPVRLAMHSPAQTAGPDDSVTEIAGRLAAAKIGAMPIVERGKLLGIATVTDVLDAEVRSAMAPTPRSMATALDAMTPYPITVSPESLLVDAATVMHERHVRHLPVLRAATVVGMLSERDLRTAIGDPAAFLATRSASLAQLVVQDVMSSPPVVLPFDTPLVEIARRFADDKIGAIPITDKFGALIGIVSYVDALRVFAEIY